MLKKKNIYISHVHIHTQIYLIFINFNQCEPLNIFFNVKNYSKFVNYHFKS